MHTDTKKILASATVGPLIIIPASIVLVIFQIIVFPLPDEAWHTYLLLYIALGIPISYGVSLIFGVPVALILRKLNSLNILSIIAVSQIGAVLVCWLMFSEININEMVLFSYFALIVAIGNWLVYKYF
ncbi:MAG: hypothetical protein GC149_15110 [Gammaproteobacteria bacterium]|nr:hypothetical protein [Gammaproteobacteria bacterium]